DQRSAVVAIDQADHDEGQEQHAQQRELIRGAQKLRELHPRPRAARTSGESERNMVAGSRPVLAVKRWESEGMLPSGRSSSMRSTRCMGKKTTPSEKGSPSFTRTTRSSNEANSMPRRLSPSALSAKIAPQNFSRGLARVATTIVPGRKGLPVARGGDGFS